jgi:hypothetical protein
MGFFKRIFGSGDEKETKRAEESVEKIATGEVDKIYPILKPGDWVGLKYGAIKQVLIGTEESPELVIGYGYDAPGNFVFLTHDMLKDKTTAGVFEEAIRNLEAFNVPVEEVLDGKMITCAGADFSSEKILCKEFMLGLHKRLGAAELLVSIPRRTTMLVTSRQNDKELLNKFIYLHSHTWHDDSFGNAPIANLLFVVIDGEINGVIRLEK